MVRFGFGFRYSIGSEHVVDVACSVVLLRGSRVCSPIAVNDELIRTVLASSFRRPLSPVGSNSALTEAIRYT